MGRKIRQGDFFSKGASIFCRGSLIKSSANTIFSNLAGEKGWIPVKNL